MKFLIKISLFLLSVCFYQRAYTQAQPGDSLNALLKTKIADTTRVKILNSLFRLNWQSGDAKLAKQNATDALALADKINFIPGQVGARVNFGILFLNSGDLDKALQNSFSALKIAEQHPDLSLRASALNCIGLSYENKGDIKNALHYHLKALYNFKKSNRLPNVAASYNNIGNIYGEKNMLDSALYYYTNAAKIKHETNDTINPHFATIIENIGLVYSQLGNENKAREYLFKALVIRDQIGDVLGVANSHLNIGAFYRDIEHYDKAKRELFEAIKFARPADDKNIISIAYLLISHCDSVLGNYKDALKYYQYYKTVKDSIFNLESASNIANIQEFYESGKKDAEIKLLNKENEIKHKELVQNKNTLIFVGAGLLLLLIFSVFIYNRFKVTQKQKLIIEKQKAEVEEQKELANTRLRISEEQKNIIEEKNKEITDSIHYASRIQRALLTSKDFINHHFKGEYFIFYQPKDIVSGDFYWADTLHNKFYFITADCTGHGVPGAFMSLLNINFLNENLKERNLTNVAEILTEQRREIVKALNPTGNENSQDGMDCVLCCYDFESMSVEFSAANNPLWLVRKSEADQPYMLTEYKADKMAVGKGEENPKDFTLQQISLQKGDLIYTFTDGYADQFGGPKNKKFRYKQLEELLLKIAPLPMNEQKNILKETINTWRGKFQQVDDILVIGVRV